MALQTINIGTVADDGTGETLRSAVDKVNDNFIENYTSIGVIEGDVATVEADITALQSSLSAIVAPSVVSKVADFTLDNTYSNQTVRVTGNVVVTIAPSLDTSLSCLIENVGSGVVTFAKGAGVTTFPSALPTLDNTRGAELTIAALQHAGSNVWDVVYAEPEPVLFIVSLSGTATDLAVAAAVEAFPCPYDITVTDIRFVVNTAPTGAAAQFDINVAGSSVLSTKGTIDATETSSSTAATALVISDADWDDGEVVSFDIDVVGSTVAGAGAKCYIYGYRR